MLLLNRSFEISKNVTSLNDEEKKKKKPKTKHPDALEENV